MFLSCQVWRLRWQIGGFPHNLSKAEIDTDGPGHIRPALAASLDALSIPLRGRRRRPRLIHLVRAARRMRACQISLIRLGGCETLIGVNPEGALVGDQHR